MAVSQSRAWYHQAFSDRKAAKRVFVKGDPSTFCQAIAKDQQVVEKATKAVAAALDEAGLVRVQIGYSHDITSLLNVLERLPLRAHLQKEAAQFAINTVGSQGQALMSLAPRRPPPGLPPQRNTEYPYNNSDGTWRSPAEEGSFTEFEVAQWGSVADRIMSGAIRILDAVARLP